MNKTIVTIVLAASAGMLQAQTYSNDFETASDLNDFNITSPGNTYSVGSAVYSPITGQTNYLAPGAETSSPSTFVLKNSVGVSANFQNTGDTAKFELWHNGTGSETVTKFHQFIGFEKSGSFLAVFGDHADADFSNTSEMGILTGSIGAFSLSTQVGPFGNSGSANFDDDTWNRMRARFIYDQATDTFTIEGSIRNMGLNGTTPGNSIASFSTSGVSAAGFSNTNLLPSLGFTSAQNGKEGHDLYSFEFTSAPEPSSTALLGLGALGLLIRRKR